MSVEQVEKAAAEPVGRTGGRDPGDLVPALAIAAALVLYGLKGAPAPAAPGWPEAAVALLLLIAAGLRQPLRLGSFGLLRSPWIQPVEMAACLALMLALWPGVLRGVFMGAAAVDMVRDLLPLAFLMLPVLVRPRGVAAAAALLGATAWALALAGLFFALRWWVDLDVSMRVIGAAALIEQPPFVLKSAAVPFAAVWFAIQGAGRVGPGAGVLRMLSGAALLVAGLISLGALAGAVHRAGFLLAAAAILLALLRRFGASAGAWLIAVTVLGGLWFLGLDAVGGTTRLAMEKTQAVGLNNRVGEFRAVMDLLVADPASFLLGAGWGGAVVSPAVGDVPITYTHNLVSYLLLKTGAVGLIGFGAYVVVVLRGLPEAWRARPDIVMALLPSLLMGLLLHTSYKYLCFGIIVMLLKVAAESRKETRN